MKIHGFLCQWKGHEQNAVALQEKIEPFIDLTVISTQENPKPKYPNWIYLTENAYFSEQWNKAVQLFSGDIFFQIQADACFDDFEALFKKVKALFLSERIGVYEPNIEVTAFQYDSSRLPAFSDKVYEVPLTDSICWFIKGDILLKLPRIDLNVNKYGWGICAAIAAITHLNNKICVRDYSFTVHHPPARGYPGAKALNERRKYIQTLEQSVAEEIKHIYKSPVLIKNPGRGL